MEIVKRRIAFWLRMRRLRKYVRNLLWYTKIVLTDYGIRRRDEIGVVLWFWNFEICVSTFYKGKILPVVDGYNRV